MKGLFWKQTLDSAVAEKREVIRYQLKLRIEEDQNIIKTLDELKDELKDAPDPIQALRDKYVEHKAYLVEQLVDFI